MPMDPELSRLLQLPSAILGADPQLKYALRASVMARSPLEDITYPTITEFLLEHKITHFRFVIFPQMSVKWKPLAQQDHRKEVPDIGVGHFCHDPPFFKLRFGVEAKRILPTLTHLPEPSQIESMTAVKAAFHLLWFQGEDQAKAFVKNHYNLEGRIRYLLFVGPYWTLIEYGPFSEAQLTVRSHKVSRSGDWFETVRLEARMQQAPKQLELYLLGTDASYRKLSELFAVTDIPAIPMLQAAQSYGMNG
jgi:hypothetical protein